MTEKRSKYKFYIRLILLFGFYSIIFTSIDDVIYSQDTLHPLGALYFFYALFSCLGIIFGLIGFISELESYIMNKESGDISFYFIMLFAPLTIPYFLSKNFLLPSEDNK